MNYKYSLFNVAKPHGINGKRQRKIKCIGRGFIKTGFTGADSVLVMATVGLGPSLSLVVGIGSLLSRDQVVLGNGASVSETEPSSEQQLLLESAVSPDVVCGPQRAGDGVVPAGIVGNGWSQAGLSQQQSVVLWQDGVEVDIVYGGAQHLWI